MFLFRLLYNSVRFGIRLMLVGIFSVAIGLVAYTFFWLPDVAFLKEKNPETTAFMEQARARYRSAGLRTRIRYTWVPLDKISPHLVDAVLVAEDDRFFQHNGFDLVEIQRSIEENIRENRWARGGSSISQQLAKNLFLTPTKNLRRKFDEMLITWKLETTLTKNRILEIYLNVVDWGGGCFGAQEAALFYFSKKASALSQDEAASLAARLPNPDLLNSEKGEDRLKSREGMILARLKGKGPGELHGTSVVARQTRQKKETSPAPVRGISPTVTSTREMVGQVTQIGNDLKDKLGEFIGKLDAYPLGGIAGSSEEKPQAGWKPLAPQSSVEDSPSHKEKIADSRLKNEAPINSGLRGNGDSLAISSLQPIPRKGDSGTPSQARLSPQKAQSEQPEGQKEPEIKKEEPKPDVPRSRRLKESLQRLEQALGK